MPHYIILKKDENGEILGYSETQSYVTWDRDYVRLWKHIDFVGRINGFPNYHWEVNQETIIVKGRVNIQQFCNDDTAFIANIHSKKCPVMIDIHDIKYTPHNEKLVRFYEKDKTPMYTSAPKCQVCGNSTDMIQHSDGWVCHSTHIID